MAQGTPTQLQWFKRQALHLNDWILKANDNHDNPTVCKEPISESKLLKVDACWSTTKVILGWTLDTLRGTIELPAHRKDRLQEILTDALHPKGVSVQAWQKLLGELRSMVLGIPGGQVSQLWPSNARLKRPTTESASTRRPVVVMPPSLAWAGSGPPSMDPYYPQHPPYVWRTPFPPQVQRELISSTNPSGTITNSDIKLAGAIAHAGALVHHRDIGECTVATFSDNTPLPGGPRPPSPPRGPPPTCSAPRAYISDAIATFYNGPTSQDPPTCSPTSLRAALTCPMLPFYAISPLFLLMHRTGRC